LPRFKQLENLMRKAIAVLAMTGALAFGGAGVAQATPYENPAPATTTTVAQSANEDDGDNTGLWGLAGLLGLLGLLGLKRRNDYRPIAGGAGTTDYGKAPHA
jgi:LPXTG-motif cell wall-anchored protein